MKKIGILTHYYKSKNIGGLLQAYALTYFLSSQKFSVQQIAFDFNFYDKKARILANQLHHVTFRKIFQKGFSVIKSVYKRFTLVPPAHIVHAFEEILAEFENFIPHSTQTFDNSNIERANSEFDVFITGSDQVFAYYLLPLSSYYGEFTTPDKKVISYAASSNMKQFPPKAEKLFIKKLSCLHAISVREKTLKEYIERITEKKATVVLDPTFLLSPQEWLQIANPAPVPQNPYIFCYFLGDKSTWQRQKAQEYADKYGYEVVHLPYVMRTVRPADRFLKGHGRYDIGPREFIALINGAQCVFTDSFHGLAFSINFGKNFYVFNRDDDSGPKSMNARITDTLVAFGLSVRHITDKDAMLDNAPLDFTQAHTVLAREKEKSIHWLLNALKD